jgi:hypothetical protein
MSFGARSRLNWRTDRLEPEMTVTATTARRLPTGHAYVVPVVREIAPRPSSPPGDIW